MLDWDKLENVQYKDGKITARCPACKEIGHDKKGNHLVIYPNGKYSCIMFPGETGKEHRKRIYKLAGKNSHKTFDLSQEIISLSRLL